RCQYGAGSIGAGSDVAGRVHLPKLLLEIDHLVPQARGEFELELGCRLQHLLVEVRDDRFELGGAGRGETLALASWGGGPLAAGIVATGEDLVGIGRLA